MNDLIDICKYSGQIMIDGQDINDPSTDPVSLRTRIGMVFQKPNPFLNPYMIILLMDHACMACLIQKKI